MQRVVHGDRRGVMIKPLAAPIFFNHGEIEIPTLHFGLTLSNDFNGAFVKSYRRKPRRAAQALLRYAVAGVDAELVDSDGRAAERRDRVDKEQRTVIANEFGDFVQRL